MIYEKGPPKGSTRTPLGPMIASLLKEGSTSTMQGEAEQVSYIRAVNKTIIGLSSVNPVSEADQQITILY